MTDEKFNELIVELDKYDKWITTLFDGSKVPHQTDEDFINDIEKILLKNNGLNQQLKKHIETTKAFDNLRNWGDKDLIQLAINNIESK
jgi:hypothetical protein